MAGNSQTVLTTARNLYAMVAQPQNYDTIGISETWWEESCDCCVMRGGYRLFRRCRTGEVGESGGSVGTIYNGGAGL